MITKERLEELIKENAKIYYLREDNWIIPIEAKNIHWDKFAPPAFGEIVYNILDHVHENEPYELWISNLYETKDRAEHALKYENVPRTEYLSLPYWEDIETFLSGGTFFYSNNKKDISFYHNNVDGTTIIGDENTPDSTLYYKDVFTKENYEKACEIAKKLWLGERV